MTTATEFGYADLPDLIGRMAGDEKHSPAATSTLDVLWVLYDRVLAIGPELIDHPERDRFLLSKGHGPMAYYAVLAAKGILDPAELDRWGRFDSPLGFHPDRVLAPGVEIGSGSLGHGLPLALGTALGLRAQGRTGPRVVVLVGDAELDEGSNHEAIAVAGRRGLGNLTTVVVDNSSSSYGWPGGIEQRFAGEGWAARSVDGRDHEALHAALTDTRPDRPLAVIARVEAKEY
ncbi:MAG: transketolase [Saccharopolyspora sp.]|uniref:thiamine pyrophosphate-dependent enzyme n=1 Tax=Saccharopolyspora TaxID=1835 RepID=UPI00190E56EE|nr:MULTISPECIES: thiamine pyrophosphate-dependent enzyme [unclassified Saccharopolyspora]MBK0867264.1 transketolase [Saccharopolyspora sp. HNM0986]MBQ6641986.1 transketolase [Saccharopolyspora sp.]